MATKSLTTSYLAQLTIANHDGVSQQICERLVNFTTANTMLQQAIALVQTRRQQEDYAFRHYSGKDFAADDLKREDALEDKYMSAIRGTLKAMLYLPDDEPKRRKAEQALQLFKDFNYRVSDGFESSARKTLNMAQEWQSAQQYTPAELGISEWIEKAVEQAQKVLVLVAVRVDNESAKVKGELARARKATDEAIRQAYTIINAMSVLEPSAELSALISVLIGIEERAKLYYIGSGKSGGTKPTNSTEPTDNGGTTPTTPDTPITPDTPDTPSGGGDTPTTPSGGGDDGGDDNGVDPITDQN